MSVGKKCASYMLENYLPLKDIQKLWRKNYSFYWVKSNDFPFLKESYNYAFQISSALNITGNYLIKECSYFSSDKVYIII